MTTPRHFTYAALTVRVSADDAAHLHWLEEFLTPAFDVASNQPPHVDIALDVDDRAYDEMLQRGPHPSGGQLACFILDSSLVELPLWAGPRARVVVHNEQYKAFHVAAPDGARVRILTCSGNLKARMGLMRVVREFAMAAAHATDRLVLHAAGVSIDGAGVIIAGAKHAGKTSLLTHLLHQPGARYVSNDRVIVDLSGPSPTFRGMPTLVTIRQPMLELFPQLSQQLRARGFDHRYALCETRPATATYAVKPNPPTTLSPAQFLAALNVEPVQGSTVEVVLFPEIDDATTGVHLHPLSREETAQRLAASLFGSGSSGGTSQLFALEAHRARVDRRRCAALCARLAVHSRGFVCQMGRDAYAATFPLDALCGDARRSSTPSDAR